MARTLRKAYNQNPFLKKRKPVIMHAMNWQTVITEIKSRLGITQVQLAKRVGVAQTSISELERGIVKDPRYTTGNALMELHRKAARKRGSAAKED